MGKIFEVKSEHNGWTVHDFLLKEVCLTRKQIRSLKFRENGILKNGQKAYVNEKLMEGDCITIAEEDKNKSSAHLLPLEGNIQILYEDSDVICLWKKPGMVVHPVGGHYQDSLSNLLQAYLLKKQEKVVIRSIGRIDADTEGVVLFAKNQISAARLWNQLEAGRLKKEYVALCEGFFSEEEFQKEQTVRLPIASMKNICQIKEEFGKKVISPEENGNLSEKKIQEGMQYKMCISPLGKEAVTHYQALERFEGATLVRFWLETGRTHQIRVHMAHLKHPLVGDPIYGNGEMGKDYTHLCAWKIRFFQPFTGSLIECQSDIPFLPSETIIHPE